MSADVEIPADLLAEVEAAKFRFQPKVKNGDEILVLGAESFIGRVVHTGPNGGALLAPDVERKMFAGVAWAYALVGRASDPSSPRPAVGDRVLVLEAVMPSRAGVIGTVMGAWASGEGLVITEHSDKPGPFTVTTWAILPPALDTKTVDDAAGRSPADAAGSEVEQSWDHLTAEDFEAVMQVVRERDLWKQRATERRIAFRDLIVERDHLTAERDAARATAASLEAELAGLRARFLSEYGKADDDVSAFGGAANRFRREAFADAMDIMDEYPHERGEGESGE